MEAHGNVFSAKDPYVWKKFLVAKPNLILKEVTSDCAMRAPFNALIKLMCRAKALILRNAKLKDYPMQYQDLEKLSIERV